MGRHIIIWADIAFSLFFLFIIYHILSKNIFIDVLWSALGVRGYSN